MKKINLYLLILLLIHTFISINIKFTAWPEMLTYPWLMNKGFRYYGDIIQPYLPLLSFILYGFYSILGFSINSLRIFTLITILISDLLVYLIVKKISNTKFANISLAFYIVLQLFFDGNGLWFDIASLPLVLLCFYLLQIRKENRSKLRLILSGIALGFAILTKQNNALFIIPSTLTIFSNLKFSKKTIFKDWLYFLASTTIPLLILIAIYSFTDQFRDFLYWGLWHPLFVHTRSQGFILWPTIKQLIIVLFVFSPVFILINKKNLILITWFFISLIIAFPRFGYFHLQNAAAFFAFMLPLLFKLKHRIFKYSLVIYIIGLSMLFVKFVNREKFLPVRFFDPQILEIRNTLKKQIPDSESVFFYNLSSEYFVGNIIPIKPWADTFPWYLEVPGVQNSIIASLEKNKTTLVVYLTHKNEGKYVPGSYVPELIDNYIKNKYTVKTKINEQISILQRNTAVE